MIDFGKVMILTFSDKEEHIIEKIMSTLADDVIFSPTNVLIKEDLSFGNLKISPAQRAAFLSDAEIALTTREFDILFFMASHPGQVFTMKQIYESTVREPSYDTFHTVSSAIYRIRKKIGVDYIVNVHGYGYKFNKMGK